MNIITDLKIKNDLNDIARLFDADGEAKIACTLKDKALYTDIKYDNKTYSFVDAFDVSDELLSKRLLKRFAKKHLYDVLKSVIGSRPLWGSLTGIRPVKLFSQMIEEQGDAEAYFRDFYDVSESKTELVKEIYRIQSGLSNDRNKVGLYVGMPFCKGRCSYCSFFSADIEKNSALVPGYINCLIKEIKCIKEYLFSSNIVLGSIYVGGGTPSSFPMQYLDKVLNELSELKTDEFTVEAGRPDSINTELLDLLRKKGVTRISINPQTANNKTLIAIGRRHTFEDFIRAFELSKSYAFTINTDIIAGLPGESIADFVKTADSVISCNPQNITLHTLAIKQGANLKINGYRHGSKVDEMLDYAHKSLHNYAYNAYYMYRQKNTAGNLENTGYSQKGFECLYNIDNMSDDADIYACGADAVSKRVFAHGRIERLGNPKDIITYCGGIDRIIDGKKDFLSIENK